MSHVPDCPVQLFIANFAKHITEADVNVIKAPFHWCTSPAGKADGPEPMGLVSAKYQFKGARLVLLVLFPDAQQFYAKSHGQSATASLGRIVSLFSEADPQLIETMSEQCKIHKVVVLGGDTLYVPLGFLVIEKPENR